MTTDTQHDAATTRTGARRAGRAITVAAAVTGALLLWAVADAGAGLDLAVRQGGTVRHIVAATVAVTAALAGLAAWALLALLERTVRRPVRTYRIIASIVLLLSLAGPIGSGASAGSRLVLAGMHLLVGGALIVGLPARPNER